MKAARKKGVVIEGAPIRFSADVPAETVQARREWEDICKVLKEKNGQPRILYLAKLSFRNEGEIKTFPAEQKLKEYIIIRPALPETLRESFKVK